MDIAANVAAVRVQIADACGRVGRDPAEVRLLPVSKTMSPELIRQAYAVGCRRFGESRAQEAILKAEQLSDLDDLSWAMIGHLQTNKAALVARFAGEFQALDSLRLAAELDRRLQAVDRQLDVLVEVNTSGDASKFGVPVDGAPKLVAGLQAFDALRVRGLMTIASRSSDPKRVGDCFQKLAQLRRELRDDDTLTGDFGELSMGMSSDFGLAIEHGATVVRIGRGIFGAR
ncbi:MAG: YggS family pyridoxal phosphate-dependent enzyme [Micropruina sp.]